VREVQVAGRAATLSGAGRPHPPDADAPPASYRRVAWIGAFVALIVAADQVTKSIAVARWSFEPHEIVGSHVQLLVTRNSGSAFSRFQNLTPVLALGALVIAIVLARAARRESDRVTLWALVLLLGGALGNLGDRIARSPGFFRGHVVDFVQVGWWPVFNLADSCVTIGAVLLVLRALFPPRAVSDLSDPPDPSSPSAPAAA
jgi:signal peptidase II